MISKLNVFESEKVKNFKPIKVCSYGLVQGDDGSVELKGEIALRMYEAVVEIRTTPKGEIAPIENPKIRTRKFPSTPNGVVKRVNFNIPLPSDLERVSIFVRNEVANVRLLVADIEASSDGKPSEALAKLKDDVFLLTRETPKLNTKTLAFTRKLNSLSLQDQASIEAFEIRAFIMAVTLRRANRAAHMITDVRKKRIAMGREDLFDEFEAHLLASIYPYVPTNHGYNVTFDKIDEQGVVWVELKNTLEEIESLGYDCFINSGTLLGAYRDGKFIDHDDDVDVAVVLKGNSTIEAVEEWIKLLKILGEMNLLDSGQFEDLGNLEIIKLKPFMGISIDLFAAWAVNGDYFVYPHTFGNLSEADVLPLKESSMHGLKMPADPEKMLEANYGVNWRTPDPYYKFPWHHARRQFSEFLTLLNESKQK